MKKEFDPNPLQTPDEMADYMNDCLAKDNGDGTLIIKALNNIILAQGIRQIAIDAGIEPAILHDVLFGESKTDLEMIVKRVGSSCFERGRSG